MKKTTGRLSGAKVRVMSGPDIALGPGKADLLEGIRETGSIAAAGRRMGMSYKRAWDLVETMNRCFESPLVETRRGGSERGGALLTPLGKDALQRYRRMEALAEDAIKDELAGLHAMLRNAPRDRGDGCTEK